MDWEIQGRWVVTNFGEQQSDHSLMISKMFSKFKDQKDEEFF